MNNQALSRNTDRRRRPWLWLGIAGFVAASLSLLLVRMMEVRAARGGIPVDRAVTERRERSHRDPQRPDAHSRSLRELAYAIGALARGDGDKEATAEPKPRRVAKGVDEAADWQEMTPEERAKIGLTPKGLYGSSQGGRWLVVGTYLKMNGQPALAAEVRELGLSHFELLFGRGDLPDLLTRERRMVLKLRSQPGWNSNMVPEMAAIERKLEGAEAGELPSVEAKILGERQTAMEQRNQPKQEHAPETKPSPAEQSATAPPDEVEGTQNAAKASETPAAKQ